ncbi:MAG TPA: hypothetical protein VFR14_05585 [Candidatus Limnocylindrales bacterium]|nr:hypothetical protein [Candidatus Limnocylindrales bacterium]
MGTSGALLVAQALAVAVAVALALALWIVLRRAGRLIAETRQIDGFRRAIDDLVERSATSLDGVTARIDAVRRHTLPAEALAENLVAATDAVERYAEEARVLRGPRGSHEIRDALVGELERASRALEMVEHGRSILTSARVGGRELEAQTAIKRGYLNLIHAREAMVRHAARAAELEVSEDVRWFQRRQT